MTELMQLRERVEGFVVPELQRQGELLATALTNAGASKRDKAQTAEGGGQGAARRRPPYLQPWIGSVDELGEP